MHGVEVARSAVVRRAIVDKNVYIGEGVRDRRRPGEGPRALPRLRRRDRRDPEGHAGDANEGRADDPRVPAGGLRRGGRARRVPRARAARVRGRRPCTLGRRADVAAHAPGTRWPATRPSSPRCARSSIDLTMAAGAAGRRRRPHATPGTRTSAGTWPSSSTGIPHVATVHSLEPLRPWKEEQLGGGYRLSSFCERTALENADAVIAVSNGTKRDILRVYPGDRPRPRARDLQRDRHRRVRARPGHRRARALRHRPGQAVASCSSGGSRARRASRTCSRRRKAFDPSAQLVLCAGSRRHARARRRGRAPRRRAAGHPRGRVLDRADAPQARGHPDPQPRDGLRLPVDLRAARASSTSRRWPARRRSSPPRPAASSRSSSTARPASSSRSSRATTARARRATRRSSPPTSPSASTR